MAEEADLYTPNFIHGFYAWLDKIPIPVWLFYTLLLLVSGLSQHIVAWSKGALPFGEWNIYLAFSAAWLIETMLIGHFQHRTSGKLIDGYRPMLDLKDDEFARLKHTFTKMPGRMGTFIFLLGIGLGIIAAVSTREISPEINFVFPALAYFLWGAGNGLGILISFQLVRQLRQMSVIFKMTKKVDIFDLSSIYAFSRYTAVAAISIFVIIYVTPLALDPTSFASEAISFQTVGWIIFSLMVFFLPLRRINRQLVAEKERMLKEAHTRMQEIFERIHTHVDEKDYQNVSGIHSLLASLKEEIEIIGGIPTWPWKSGTLRALIATLALPIALSYLQKLTTLILGF
jgi:hypothetical protein